MTEVLRNCERSPVSQVVEMSQSSGALGVLVSVQCIAVLHPLLRLLSAVGQWTFQPFGCQWRTPVTLCVCMSLVWKMRAALLEREGVWNPPPPTSDRVCMWQRWSFPIVFPQISTPSQITHPAADRRANLQRDRICVARGSLPAWNQEFSFCPWSE